jgi:hypothetical protein
MRHCSSLCRATCAALGIVAAAWPPLALMGVAATASSVLTVLVGVSVVID